MQSPKRDERFLCCDVPRVNRPIWGRGSYSRLQRCGTRSIDHSEYCSILWSPRRLFSLTAGATFCIHSYLSFDLVFSVVCVKFILQTSLVHLHRVRLQRNQWVTSTGFVFTDLIDSVRHHFRGSSNGDV